MTKAITTVLAQKPDMWAKVLDKLKELGRVPSLFGIIPSIAQQTGVPKASVFAAHRIFTTDPEGLRQSLSKNQEEELLCLGLVALFWYALLIPEKRKLWETYPNTNLELGTEPKLVIDLRQAVPPQTIHALKQIGLQTSFAVLTACDPLERPASQEENRRWTNELGSKLRTLRADLLPADGVSTDGAHREVGYAAAIPIETATDLAKRFRQAAYFWFDGKRFWIMPALVRAEPVPLPLTDNVT